MLGLVAIENSQVQDEFLQMCYHYPSCLNVDMVTCKMSWNSWRQKLIGSKVKWMEVSGGRVSCGPLCFSAAFICGHSSSSKWEEGSDSSCLWLQLWLLISCLQHSGTSRLFVIEDCQQQAACRFLWKPLPPIKSYSKLDMDSTFLYYFYRMVRRS